jgi:DNA modification methylase
MAKPSEAPYFELMPLGELLKRRHPDNAKDHDLGLIVTSIKKHGLGRKPSINEVDGKLFYGHGTTEALALMFNAGDKPPDQVVVENGDWLIPVERGKRLSRKLAASYRIADNRATELGGWLEPKLIETLRELDDLAGTGFDDDDVNQLIQLHMPGLPEQEPKPDELELDYSLLERGPAFIVQGDAARIPLDPESVHCVMTSPPYWGKRVYAGDQGEAPLGLEPTPELHIERIVAICQEIRRVLRPDGVLWFNYGDSHFGDSPVRAKGSEAFSDTWDKTQTASRGGSRRSAARRKGFQPGSLTMMPFRIAIALAEDGWIVRQIPIWYKRNPMPESPDGWRWQRERTEAERIEGAALQTGNKGSAHMMGSPDQVIWDFGDDFEFRRGSWRHTTNHEYIFMLTKRMLYWGDKQAVRELGTSQPSDVRKMEQGLDRIGGKTIDADDPLYKANRRTRIGQKRSVGSPLRNPRSVLDVTTIAYPGQHYATFPPKLITPLIEAACPRWTCPVCGQGWAPVVETYYISEGGRGAHEKTLTPEAQEQLQAPGPQGFKYGRARRVDKLLGYKRTCEHEHTREEAVPGIVLDPFMGSGTTGMVARALERRWFGLDISREYLLEQARFRILSGEPEMTS